MFHSNSAYDQPSIYISVWQDPYLVLNRFCNATNQTIQPAPDFHHNPTLTKQNRIAQTIDCFIGTYNSYHYIQPNGFYRKSTQDFRNSDYRTCQRQPVSPISGRPACKNGPLRSKRLRLGYVTVTHLKSLISDDFTPPFSWII